MHIEKSSTISRILIVGLLLLIGSQIAGCDWFSSLTDAEHVSRAKDFKEKGELRASLIELKNALQKNPKNAEARWLLGSINVELGYGSAAEKELRRGQELGIAREAVLAPLARALLMQGKNQEILDEIGIAEKLSPTEQAKLVAFRGDALMGLRNVEKARAEYEKALTIDATSSAAKLGLARLAANNNDLSKAQTLIAEGIKVSPEDPFLWSFQGDLLSNLGDQEEAEASFTKAIELRPANFIDRGKRALIRIERKEYADAEEDISVLKKDAPNYFQSHFAAGMLAFKQKDYKQAETDFEQTLNLNGKHPQARYYLGLAQLIQGSFEQADDHLSRFLNAYPKSIAARKLVALTRFRLKKYKKAKRVLLPVLNAVPDDVYTLKLMASIEFALGNSDSGLEHLQKVAELEPDSPESRAKLGIGQLMTGNKDQGLRELEKAIELDPQMSQAEAYIAFVHIRAKEFKQAEQVIDRLKKKQPDSPLPSNIEGMLFLAKKDAERAGESFQAALKMAPDDVTASNYLARLAIKDKNYKEARIIFEKLQKSRPKDIATQLKLAQLDAMEGKPKDMEGRLAKMVEDHPKSLQPRLVLGRYYLRFGQPERVQTLLSPVLKDHPSNQQLLALLVSAQIEDKQPTRAVNSARELLKAAPESAYAEYLLANAYGAKRDTRNMRAAIQRSLRIDPQFALSRLANAKLKMIDGKLVEAEKELTRLSQVYPKSDQVLALRGRLAGQQGLIKDAIAFFQRAQEIKPSAVYITNLAQFFWNSGDKDKAMNALEKWNKDYPKDTLVRYMRAGLSLKLGQQEQAKELLATIIKKNPKNVFALNDLAWLVRKESPREALEFAERATKLASKSAPILDTLAMVLLENSQQRRALRIIRQAISIDSNSLSLRYHLAVIQSQNGQKEDAIKTLTGLLSSEKDFEERIEAEELHKKLKG